MNYEEIKERYDLSMDRIETIVTEETIDTKYREFFKRSASYILEIRELYNLVQSGELSNMTIEQLQAQNQRLYKEVQKENYQTSYTNPEYAVEKCGQEYGQILSFLAAELRTMIPYIFQNRLFNITICLELFIEIYNIFEEKEESMYKEIKEAIYYFMSDYCSYMTETRVEEILNPEVRFAVDIIENSNLEDLRYLYMYGEYVSDNEIKIAQFLNSLPEEQMEEMAKTYTQGYAKGFELQRKDLSTKKVVNIRYPLGFERMVYFAIKQFAKKGLKPIVVSNTPGGIYGLDAGGYSSTSPNKQFEYDHRFDKALYFDKAFVGMRLEKYGEIFEKYKDLAADMAGPAVIESFGEEPFVPVDKKAALKLDEKQQKLHVQLNQELGIKQNNYIKQEEISFTIISYPTPEIGEKFNEIFEQTVKVNTLNCQLYESIQNAIIDTLDKGEYVHITGHNGNRTDFKVSLHKLSDPEKETNFENCLADVNIPVGEVFTSPKLSKTNGILHVSEVYLHGLNYKDLELEFEDGMIKSYNCSNFKEPKSGVAFIKENLLYNHDTLPISEFAIGTNTTAYVMAKKYNISNKLPILIAEKTGPHFAVGDTCYRMYEDMKLYNPNGKEIVAKDNEISIKRKDEIDKAYFGCHTDITIPYGELKEIAVCTKEGNRIPIIQNGRFVLEGTQELNKAFESENEE